MANKYQSVRKLQLRLINTIGKLKDRHQARQSLKVTMPCFTGRASEWNLFKREFHSWSQHLTETERRVSFLKAIEATEIKNKVSSVATYKEMLRALDSYFGNSQVIISKLFADLQKLSKPSFLDYKTENENALKIMSYLSFLESVGRSDVSIFESQGFCSLLRTASMETYIETLGDLGSSEGTSLAKVRSFLDGLIQKNDKIISTKASISNMRSKPHDKSHNDDKRSPKPKHKKSHDIKAMKINITKEQNKDKLYSSGPMIHLFKW